MFLGIFKPKSMFFGPPWKILPSPGKKFGDAHDERLIFDRDKVYRGKGRTLFIVFG